MKYISTTYQPKPVFTLLAILLLTLSKVSYSQITVYGDQTAAALAATLTGPGVTVLSPTLNCNGAANGKFVTGAIDPVGVAEGIVLATGYSADTIIGGTLHDGITHPASVFESGSFTPSISDADLAALSGGTTYDACVLEFDFKAAGDTVKFNYVFASEEYPEFACSSFNDVFGFLISGGVTSPSTSYPTPYNIARIPGTAIPVCINSVNEAPTGTSYPLSTCSAVGPGSPFSMYYVDNSASTMLVYDGMTTVMTAIAAVSPCDTYHLKLGIADVGDNAYSSGVFIEGGSLTSTVPTTITATGTSGLPYCIRGCDPGNFIFTIPEEQDTSVTVHFDIIGTAVNGYDYTTIADSVIIPAHDTADTLYINPLLVPAAGPKVVTLQILKEDPCHPGVFTPASTASLTILDSFNFHILTPDTAVCAGEIVHLRAVGDSLYDSVLHYTWTPGGSISNDTLLYTNATPVMATTYSLTATANPALGCIPQTKTVTVSMYPNPVLTVDSTLVKTCLGMSVPLHAYASPPGTAYSYSWLPATDLSATSVYNPTVTPTLVGDVVYTVTVYPTALPACASSEEITVHTVPNDFVLNNHDTAICTGEFVQVSISGWPEFSWVWTPVTGVSDPTAMEPIITPSVNGTYSVLASYANCPDMMHSFYIEVDTPAPYIGIYDTICIPMTYTTDLTVPWSTGTGNGYYHYQWTPATLLSNDTIPNPLISPTVPGSFVYTVTVQPHAVGCRVDDIVSLYVLPNTINLVSPDTAICHGQSVQIRATGHPLFTYQWLPTAGIALSNTIAPMITPDTSALYKIQVSFHLCPTFYDSLYIDVQPNPEVFIGGNRFVCEHDTVRLIGKVAPEWYTHYSYAWAPGAHLNVTDEKAVVLTGIDTGNIVLAVSTPAGCTGVDSAMMIVLPGNFATMDDYEDFCPHESKVLTPEGGVSYHWTPSIYLDNDRAAAPVISPITSQAYTVIATSQYGCEDTLYFMANVFSGADMYLEDSVRLYPGESYHIQPQTNCTKFSWSPAVGLNGRYYSDPVATPEVSTKYIVTALTENGCRITDSINVIVETESVLTLPNAFAPGSGVNNEFKIIKKGVATLNYFRIFNRWGNLIFETKDIEQGWNGEFKGVPQPVGVYVYQVQAVTSTGKIFNKQGNVTLLR